MIRWILIFLFATAQATELQFTITGDAVPLSKSDAAPVPFTVSFSLDSLSGNQSFTYGTNNALQLFSAVGASITNFSASVNGLLLLSAANLSGKFWGNALAGDPAPPNTSFDAGLQLPPFDGGDFKWNFMTVPNVPQGSADPLGMLLSQSTYPGDVGEINQQWGLENFRVSVVDPPVNVAEPGLFALFALGLASIGIFRWRGGA